MTNLPEELQGSSFIILEVTITDRFELDTFLRRLKKKSIVHDDASFYLSDNYEKDGTAFLEISEASIYNLTLIFNSYTDIDYSFRLTKSAYPIGNITNNPEEEI